MTSYPPPPGYTGSDDKADNGGTAAKESAPAPKSDTSTPPPGPRLPPGCELLTQPQVLALVPNAHQVDGSGPAKTGDGMASSCDWAGAATQLDVTATAYTDDGIATTAMSTTCGSHSEDIGVTGADGACVRHLVTNDDTGEPIDSASITARYRGLVVEVDYSHNGEDIEHVDLDTANTTAAIIGAILQAG